MKRMIPWLFVVVWIITVHDGLTAQTTNIAPSAKIYLWPHPDVWETFSPSPLTDGSLYWPQKFYGNIGKQPARFEFRFDRPYSVNRVRLHQGARNENPLLRGNFAYSYRIMADRDGDGTYETQLAENSGLTDPAKHCDAWFEHTFQATSLRAVKFEPLEGDEGVFPTINEFEIYAIDTEPLSVPEFKARVSTNLTFSEDHGWAQELAAMPVPDAKHRLRRGLFVIPYDYLADRVKSPEEPLAQCPPFQNTVKALEAAHIDHIWFETVRLGPKPMDPPMYYRLLWPSKVGRGVDQNILAQFSEVIHQKDWQGIFWNHGRITGLRDLKTGLPPHDLSPEKACRLHGDVFRDTWSAVLKESMEMAGLDGAAVAPDEWQYGGGHFIGGKPVEPSDLPPSDPCHDAFRKRFGRDHLPRPGEDQVWREMVQFDLEGVAALYQHWAKVVHDTKPDAMTTTLLIANPMRGDSLDARNAWDLVGHAADIDYLCTDIYSMFPKARFATRLMRGANFPDPGTMIVFKGGPWGGMQKDTYSPFLEFAAGAMSAVFAGGKGACVYRYDYLRQSGYLDWASTTFEIMEHLSRLGIDDATTPRDIALLYSRAGEDWHWYNRRSTVGEGDPEIYNGYLYQQKISDLLLSHGYPFDLFYLDQADDVQHAIDNYRMLVVPFAHAVQPDVAAKLEKAAAQGKPIILVHALGELDYLGIAHKSPLLKSLLKHKSVTFLKGDEHCWMGDVTGFAAFGDQLLSKVDEKLGGKRAMRVDRAGLPVDYLVDATPLLKGDREAFVLVTNGGPWPITLGLGLDLADGQYDVRAFELREQADQSCMYGMYKASGDSHRPLTDDDLRDFGVSISPRELWVLHVKRSTKD